MCVSVAMVMSSFTCAPCVCVCEQMLSGTSLPVATLVKVKEGLLRQRELEIDRYHNTHTH